MVAPSTQGKVEEMEASIEVQSFSGPMFRSAVAETQGRRPSYEDAFAITSQGQFAFFWIFDGHRGDCASKFAAELFSSQEFGPIKDEIPSDKRILRAFQNVDRRLRSHLGDQKKGGNAGSTAVGALASRARDGTYSAKLVNCGDSRGVVIRAPSENEKRAAAIKVRLPKSLDHIRQAAQGNWSQDAS
eukprot:gb/GFBE01080274.1/.p1 GENE.gb/GFBE01080274.1/~~gb/GFBE01080274.1/.p1  ORF type:complete len:187 (+),score=36.38 gb/GFBE01080274.1/:1-561(+)